MPTTNTTKRSSVTIEPVLVGLEIEESIRNWNCTYSCTGKMLAIETDFPGAKPATQCGHNCQTCNRYRPVCLVCASFYHEVNLGR